ncbi:MAG: 2-oxoglutarate dehydrogenase complex dihydrolipoyllysine-residue succinyltransferase [Candidatus Latescibacteria bacterium]|nr:2-oxoglutarate dehydrogenase complex dihydrolipoyllysine-residue succinyltransferase [Candidatus Latescibacterota bacterium]
MATEVVIPKLGESIAEVVLLEWLKADGERVERDQPVCVLETDKANVDLPAPVAGYLRRLKEPGQTLKVGEAVARIEAEAGAAAPAPASATAAPTPAAQGENLSPAVRRLVEEHHLDPASLSGTGKGGRLTKEDVLAHLEKQRAPAPAALPPVLAAPAPAPAPAPISATAAAPLPPTAPGEERTRRVPMSKLRLRIAERLVAAQHQAAMLTTFNEVDLSAVMALRSRYKERFTEVHGVSLGLMSFFSRAVALGLQKFPAVNARIDALDVVYHDYVHLSIAVSTERGLVVPVVRHVQEMSLARIETEIKRLAKAARENKLSPQDLSGGTFTITNGGVFGSLLSTPILNLPQSGILGMHAIKDRPIAVEGRVEIRPMMYLALSYDHRLVDGEQSVSFLVRVKELLEDPSRMLLEI